MQNLSNFVSELDLVRLDLTDDAGDWRTCVRDERQSGASQRKAALSARVHAHDGLLVGRAVGCRAVSRAALLE